MTIASSVLSAFPKFSSDFEGLVPFMYLDKLGLVTTGVGNLINSVAAAQELPWKEPGGAPATKERIASEWQKVHALVGVRNPKTGNLWTDEGGGHFGPFTTIRLSNSDIGTLFLQKMKSNDTYLLKQFPSYHVWPADAQLALHSMAWAMGPSFKYPKFAAAVNKVYPDFLTAAKESYMPDNAERDITKRPTLNPGLRPRNIANALLFTNAAISLKLNRALDALTWPSALDVNTVKKTSPWLLGGIGVTVAGVVGYQLTKKA